jgi:hypothetical protein
MALAALGLTQAPVHEPVHDHHSERLMSTTERYHAPREIRRSAWAMQRGGVAVMVVQIWLVCAAGSARACCLSPGPRLPATSGSTAIANLTLKTAGGAGGARTHDRQIMSPASYRGVICALTCVDTLATVAQS